MIPADRRSKILQSYVQIRPMVQFLAKTMIPKGVMLDVGCGEGVIALETVKDLGVARSILTDINNDLIVDLPSSARFEKVDACGADFLRRFQNQVTVVTCFTAFHEFADPNQAALNLISVLPERGMTLVLDYSEEGWCRQKSITDQEGADSIRHHYEDMRRTRRWGLDTNQGIRRFWENWFSRVPGQCCLQFSGDLYSVLYVALQWGVVKPFPAHLIK